MYFAWIIFRIPWMMKTALLRAFPMWTIFRIDILRFMDFVYLGKERLGEEIEIVTPGF